jgi:hypothetical protein
MKLEKDFDCVVMKTEIQERLLHEIAELGEAEAERWRAERLLSDPILGNFLRTKLANVQKYVAEHDQLSPAKT